MTTALVTGANKGIGLATVRALLDLGWTVWLGSRDAGRGRAAVESLTGDVRPVDLDVTDDASVAGAVGAVSSTGLDVLVNNAGISRTGADPGSADELSGILEVNVVGALRVARAFIPLLAASADGRVVNVSSSLGSFALASAPGAPPERFAYPAYTTSKSALNMLTVQLARTTAPEVRLIAVEPGYTATDLNGFAGLQTPERAAAVVVGAATTDLPTGCFVGADGPIAW